METMSVSMEKQKFLETMSRSLSRSFGGSMNKSFTQPGFLEAYYNFQYSNISPLKEIGSPTTNLAMLEDKFCKDFNCCNLQLEDMHELLQHFEECHVVIEDDDMDEDDDLQFQFDVAHNSSAEMDIDNQKNAFSEMGYGNCKKSRSTAGQQSVALSDIYQNDSVISAFETSVVRKRSTSHHDSKLNNAASQPWLRPISDSPPQTFPVILTQEVRQDTTMETSPTSTTPTLIALMDDLNDCKEDIDEKDDRPYKCKIPGCNKSYKNPGGLKYHLHHGHCEDTGDPEMNNMLHKPYQCTVPDCGKRYKNLNGLKYHTEHAHIDLQR